MSIKDEINFPIVSYLFFLYQHSSRTSIWMFNLSKRYYLEEIENTKEVIRISISKKNRQHNEQKKKVQKDKQRSTKHPHQTKDLVART